MSKTPRMRDESIPGDSGEKVAENESSLGTSPGETWDEDEGAADYATFALKRAQDIASTQGKMRLPLRRRKRRFYEGDNEDTASEISLTRDGKTRTDGGVDTGEEGEFSASRDTHSTRDDESVPRPRENSPLLNADEDGDLTFLARASERIGVGWARLPGMAATRPRYREPRTLGFGIKRLIQRSGWDVPTRMGSVMVQWPMIVGEDVARHCEIETFEDRVLVVRCSSTAWAKQLQLLIPTIERRIAEEVGEGVVRQLIVRGPAAPSWKKGRFSVPGRGPRDTYG